MALVNVENRCRSYVLTEAIQESVSRREKKTLIFKKGNDISIVYRCILNFSSSCVHYFVLKLLVYENNKKFFYSERLLKFTNRFNDLSKIQHTFKMFFFLIEYFDDIK